ncbi:hypothetical protein CP556_08730 [Natrinema sp. CBA1119]|uniref:fibronectin type III domain-containing protein n=1 Tax=Natrinema sp. CBA1119 TaxID=1608465 RepID=UPI000BF28FA9|nr:glycine-rich protein [Natrinema sp. CBA1119]PGF16189.1 hypothetical protein CP556_08730 [Natrinema sp. CBA1119]
MVVFDTVGNHTYTSDGSQILIRVWGAQGGGDDGDIEGWRDTGGVGGYAEGVITPNNGETLDIYVGERPTGYLGGSNGGGDGGTGSGPNGYGGGGASDVRRGGTSLSDRIIIAGGGGGLGMHSGNLADGPGGEGGGLEGHRGYSGESYSDVLGGYGGGQTSGGSGANEGDPGTDGSLGQGGYGGFSSAGAGGGGGGYYGGGGGSAVGSDDLGGGGGGGSGYVDSSLSSTTLEQGNANATGHGKVEIITSPSEPTDLSVDATDDTTADLSWTDNASDEEECRIYRDTSSGVAIDSSNRIATLSANTTTYSDTGLSNGQTYYYVVTAYNVAGESASNEASGTTTIPGATDMAATAVDYDTIDLSWTDNAIDEAGYRVYWDDGSGYTQIADLSANSTVHTHSNATAGVSNTYYVEAYTADSTAASGTASAIPDPAPPESPSATPISSDRIDLDWDDPNNPSGTVYNIHRATSSGSTTSDYSVVASGVTGTAHSDTGLTDGRKYHYRIEAEKDGTKSNLSNEAAVTTNLPSPTLDSLTADTLREIDIAWILSDDNSDGQIHIYRDGASIASISRDETMFTDTGVDLDGEQYSYSLERDTGDTTASSGTDTVVTVLPAPTTLSVDAITVTSADISWTDNHNYGDTRIEFKQSDVGSWTTVSTLSRNTEAETLTDLLHGERYDTRVVAVTEHTETEGQ